MRCKNAKILISASMDGELSQREDRSLRRHLRQCAECAREQAQVSNLRDVMAVWTDEEPSDWLAQNFAYRLKDEMERKPARRVRRSGRVFGTAAAGFATVLLAFGIILHSQLFPPETTVTQEPTTTVTQPAKPARKPAVDDNASNAVKPNTGRSEERVAVAPQPTQPERNTTIVHTPDRTTAAPPKAPVRAYRPTPKPRPKAAAATASAGPGPLTGRIAVASDAGTASGSRSRTTDLTSRGQSSREAEVKRTVLRNIMLASNAEDDRNSTVANQLAKADLSMNESVEEVRGILCKAADTLSRSENRPNSITDF